MLGRVFGKRLLCASARSPPLELTDSCIQRMKSLTETHGSELILRVAVTPGGCEGFQYAFSWEDGIKDTDTVVEKEGCRVVVDPTSLGFVSGSRIDFVDELVRSAFVIASNPNAESGCGCGSSFNPVS